MEADYLSKKSLVYKRDPNTKALINNDINELKRFKIERKKDLQLKECLKELKTIKEELDHLKAIVNELKNK